MRKYLLILVFVLANLCAQAQEETVSVRPAQVTTVVNSGHSPTKALLLSLIPGAGQIYNGHAWKVPIFYAALGGVGYMTYNYYTEMKMFKEEYLRIGYNGSSTMPEYQGYPGSSIYNMYQTANKNFQTFCIVVAAVYGFNLLDAYVFGHLYDFDVNDNLSMHVGPSLAPTMSAAGGFGVSPALNLSLTF